MKIRDNKVVVLGAGGVGKTSLVVQFMEGFFTSAYKPTVEDCYRHTIQLPGGIFHTVEILDTAGSFFFPSMRELSIRSGRGFVLVFSLDNLQSFHECVSIWELIVKLRGPSVPTVLVGNKSDLPDSDRQVTQEHIDSIRREVMKNSVPFVETSAKNNSNVGRLFLELLEQAKHLDDMSSSCPGTPTGRGESGGSNLRRISRRLSNNLPNMNLLLMRRKSSSSSLKSSKAMSECSPMSSGRNTAHNTPRHSASSCNGIGMSAVVDGMSQFQIRDDKCVIL